jgi:hypothetical protein
MLLPEFRLNVTEPRAHIDEASKQLAQASAEFAQQVLHVDAVLGQKPAVLIGVNLLRQVLLCLISLVLITLLLEELDNLVFVDLHDFLHDFSADQAKRHGSKKSQILARVWHLTHGQSHSLWPLTIACMRRATGFLGRVPHDKVDPAERDPGS